MWFRRSSILLQFLLLNDLTVFLRECIVTATPITFNISVHYIDASRRFCTQRHAFTISFHQLNLICDFVQKDTHVSHVVFLYGIRFHLASHSLHVTCSSFICMMLRFIVYLSSLFQLYNTLAPFDCWTGFSQSRRPSALSVHVVYQCVIYYQTVATHSCGGLTAICSCEGLDSLTRLGYDF